LGREKQTVEFVHALLGVQPSTRARRIGFQPNGEANLRDLVLPPLVIDADGLNALVEAEGWWTHVPHNSVLTPHPGEMGRLTGMGSTAVNEARLSVAREYAAKWNQVIVLKGAYTVVAAPDGRVSVMPFANPGLATAGTGDVLAGAVVGYLAQGLEPFDAALCGAYVHGLAGQIATEQMGRAGLVASDLLPALPQAIARLTGCPG
jgi:NAD(P)H-hydrate epimerase